MSDVVRSGKLRKVFVTLHVNDGFDGSKYMRDLFAVPCIVFVCGQLERGDTTGALHLQYYVQANRSQRFSWWKRQLGNRAHIEHQKGTNEETRAYCIKEDTRVAGPWSFGTFVSGAGARTDLDTAIELLRQGGMTRVAEEFPAAVVRYHRGLRALEFEWRRPRTRKPIVTILYGPTGVGKTYAVHQDSPDVFTMAPGVTGRWWTGWDGSRSVLLDEFDYTEWPVNWMLRFLDEYPMNVSVHGGSLEVHNFDHVYLTSNIPPNEWYSTAREGVLAAFRRRVDFIFEMPERGTVISRQWE